MIDLQEDKDKFNEIHEKYEVMMYRVIYSVLKNKEDTEDALQDAFMTLAKNISKIDSVSCRKTETLLVILSRNTAIDHYRKNKRQRENVELWQDEDIDNLESSATLDSLSKLVSKEGYRHIVACIEAMGDTYKDAMRLRFVLGYSNSEVAAQLGITKKNAEVRITRGRAQLIETLEKEGNHVVG
jgi:RNA polymerase sigma-70 factor (ECF subfamily)